MEQFLTIIKSPFLNQIDPFFIFKPRRNLRRRLNILMDFTSSFVFKKKWLHTYNTSKVKRKEPRRKYKNAKILKQGKGKYTPVYGHVHTIQENHTTKTKRTKRKETENLNRGKGESQSQDMSFYAFYSSLQFKTMLITCK